MLALTLVLLVTACEHASGPTAPPNIVIFIADDLGWDDVGAYGNSFIETPNIDALASGGLRFDNAFLTISSCSPSRASILTGRYPHTNGSMHLHQGLPEGEITFARHLRSAGYYTASIGKWHERGYVKKDFDRVVRDQSASGAEQWLPELRNRPRGRPFFFWLAALDPHRKYDDDEPDLPAPIDPAAIELPWSFVDGPGVREKLAQYYREVQRFDRYVGDVVAYLEEEGEIDNTLIIVMSDNGRPFHVGKMTLYDVGIKTPFILHWPARIESPGVRSQLVSSIDLAPALLQLAGLKPPDAMQGHSLVPLIDGPDVEIRDRIFAERNWHRKDAHERALRTHSYLYKVNQYPLQGHCSQGQYAKTPGHRALEAAVQAGEVDGWLADCFADEWPEEELYLIEAGRQQWQNLAADPAYREVLERYRADMDRWRRETGDTDFEPWVPDEES
ncbi:MAG: sulfatase [Halieaceae bacterium]|nr:sulfatase [Halieaceae bacterium]